MKSLKKILAVVLALSMIFAFAACGSTEEASEDDTPMTKLEQIKAAGKIVVGTSADYPPFQFHAEIDGVDTIVGTEISLVNYIAEKMGVEVELVDMSFDGLVISLSKGDFDIVASCMRPSEERKQSIDFTDSWYDNNTVIVVKKGDEDKFSSLYDLEGHKIAAQAGATQYEWVAQFAGEENAVGLSKVSDMILDLKAGNVEGVLLEELTARTYAAKNDDLAVCDIEYKEATGLTATEGAAIGMQKGDNEDLAEFINECIAQAKEEGLIGQWAAEASELAGVE